MDPPSHRHRFRVPVQPAARHGFVNEDGGMEPRSWREDPSRKRLGFSAYDNGHREQASSSFRQPLPVATAEPVSQTRQRRLVKRGEELAGMPDLDGVDRDHQSGVLATIKCVVTLAFACISFLRQVSD